MTRDNKSHLSVSETLGVNAGPRRKKRLKWIIAATLLFLGAVAGSLALTRDVESPASAQYKTQPAQRGDLTVTVNATGNLEPTNQVDVGSELSGTIRSVHAEDNDQVKVNQVLARLDTSKLEAQHSKNKAELASARAKVLQTQATTREAENNLARLRHVRELSGNKVPSPYDLDAAEAALARARADEESATASVAQAQAILKGTETDLGKSVIRSPINGVVLDRSVEPGQTVAASLQSPVLFTLAEDLAQMELNVGVDEADVGEVRPGQEAAFLVDAYPHRTFNARIIRVCYGSKITGGVVTYETVLEVENKDLSLRPGMTATADIIVEKVKDVLLVPNAALRFAPPVQKKAPARRSFLGSLLPRPPGQKAQEPNQVPSGSRRQRVWMLKNGHPIPIPVTTGVTDGIRTQIMDGELPPGSEVIVETLQKG